MQSIDKRIAALEEVGKPRDQITIIRRIVSPGHLDAELNHMFDHLGNEWTRQRGESQSEFTARAFSEAHNKRSVANARLPRIWCNS